MGAPSSADWGQKIHHTQEGPLSWHREKQKINNSTSYSTYYGDVWGTMCCKKGVWIYLFIVKTVQKLGGASAPSWIDLFEDAVKCPLAHNPLTDALCSIS